MAEAKIGTLWCVVVHVVWMAAMLVESKWCLIAFLWRDCLLGGKVIMQGTKRILTQG